MNPHSCVDAHTTFIVFFQFINTEENIRDVNDCLIYCAAPAVTAALEAGENVLLSLFT